MKYRAKFERESASLKKEQRVMLRGIFINGLKEEIQAELKLHATGTLDELVDRALLLEEKNNALRKGGLMIEEKKGWCDRDKLSNKGGRGYIRDRWTSPKIERGGNKEGNSKGDDGTSKKKLPLGSKLSQDELRDRSRKGLCFKCGENWGHDHVCKLKHYKFVLVENSEEEGEEGRIH